MTLCGGGVAMFGLVALVLCVIVPLLTAQVANITDPPRAVNISVGGLAEFNCTAAANELIWSRNGRQIDNGTDGVIISPTVAVGNARKSNLKIKVTSTDDSANITCYAYYTESLSNVETTALLLVQGKLKPAQNLNVDYINSTTVLISWSPPFTLEGVPILGYRAIITNVTSGENETISVEGDTTMLYYTIDHPDQVDNFTVTLTCINQVGEGEKTSMIFSMSVDSVVTTLQVISSTSMMASILTQSVTPVVSSTITVNQSNSPHLFTENQPGIIAAVIVPIIFILIVCTGVIFTVICYRSRRKQKGLTQQETSYAELVRREKNQEGGRVSDQNNILDQLQATNSLENEAQLLENGSPNQNGLPSQTEPSSQTDPPNQTKPPSELLESLSYSQDISSDQGVSSDTTEESSPEDETDDANTPLLKINRQESYPIYIPPVHKLESHSLPPNLEKVLKAASSTTKVSWGETQALLGSDDAN